MDEKIRDLEQAILALNTRLAKLEHMAYGDDEIVEEDNEAPPPTPKVKKDSSIGMSKILAVVSVICFVMAASFIVKLAVETGWLTPFRQWAGLVILGGALGVSGRFLTIVDKQYRSYLSASGLIVLYVAAYTSCLYFNLFSENFAIILGMAVSAIGLLMFQHHESQLFPVISVVGTYLSIVIMRHPAMTMNFQGGFFIIWAILFSWFSTHFRSRVINLLATYHGLGVLTWLNLESKDGNHIIFALILLTVQFVIFTWGVAHYTMKNRVSLSKFETWSYFPAICFYYGVMYFFINAIAPTFAPWIGLGMALSFVLMFESIKKRLQGMNVEASQTMVYSFMALVLAQAGYLELFPDSGRPWLLPAFFVLNFISERKKELPKTAIAFKILAMGISAIEFGSLLLRLMELGDPAAPLVAFVTLVLGVFYYLNKGKLIQSREKSFLGMVHVLAVLALYRVTYEYGSLAVSGAWAIYAIFILSLGYFKKDVDLVKSSLVVLFFASGKALLYDGSGAPSSVRIGSLLFTGILLFGTGVLFRKMQNWKKA